MAGAELKNHHQKISFPHFTERTNLLLKYGVKIFGDTRYEFY